MQLEFSIRIANLPNEKKVYNLFLDYFKENIVSYNRLTVH